MKYSLTINERNFEVEVGQVTEGIAQVSVNSVSYEVKVADFAALAPARMPAALAPAPAAMPVPAPAAPAGGGALVAPIPGLIIEIRVKVGDQVTAGQVVGIMEAMKMENDLKAATSGSVQEIRVQKGAEVSTGDVIMVIG